jgi:predicted DNA binding CopG/RHH family protein
MNLSKEEKELLDSLEKGEWERVPNFEAEAENLKAAARATKAHQQVSIEINEADLQSFQRQAQIEGISYQTYISRVLHRYINGQL